VCAPSTRDWKDIDESNLKIVEGASNISCSYVFGQLDCLHQINDKDIANLCKFNLIIHNALKKDNASKAQKCININ